MRTRVAIWRPFTIACVLVVLMNLVPIGMAQISETWMRVGWVFYFYTLPLGLLIVLVGLVWSLRRRRTAVTSQADL